MSLQQNQSSFQSVIRRLVGNLTETQEDLREISHERSALRKEFAKILTVHSVCTTISRNCPNKTNSVYSGKSTSPLFWSAS